MISVVARPSSPLLADTNNNGQSDRLEINNGGSLATIGGCPESGVKGIHGNKTRKIDPLTGEAKTTGDSFVNSGCTVRRHYN